MTGETLSNLITLVFTVGVVGILDTAWMIDAIQRHRVGGAQLHLRNYGVRA